MGLLVCVTTCRAHTTHKEAASLSYFQGLTLGLLMDTINFLFNENTNFWVSLCTNKCIFCRCSGAYPPWKTVGSSGVSGSTYTDIDEASITTQKDLKVTYTVEELLPVAKNQFKPGFKHQSTWSHHSNKSRCKKVIRVLTGIRLS